MKNIAQNEERKQPKIKPVKHFKNSFMKPRACSDSLRKRPPASVVIKLRHDLPSA